MQGKREILPFTAMRLCRNVRLLQKAQTPIYLRQQTRKNRPKKPRQHLFHEQLPPMSIPHPAPHRLLPAAPLPTLNKPAQRARNQRQARPQLRDVHQRHVVRSLIRLLPRPHQKLSQQHQPHLLRIRPARLPIVLLFLDRWAP